MDIIDKQSRITLIPKDQTLISEKLRDKGGQGTRPQYYRQRPHQEAPPEEESPAENGQSQHLIDIKV
ncbi:MAG: hypothetical protein ACOZF2_03650 [Thermodesulfobacteriota bacterium]